MALGTFLSGVRDAVGANVYGKRVKAVCVGNDVIREDVRNLATNPSFEATVGTIEVRRNFHRNPVNLGTVTDGRAEGNNAYLTGAGTAATFEVFQGWQMVNVTNIGAGGRAGINVYVPLTGATAGTPINFSLDRAIRNLPAGAAIRLWVDPLDANGAIVPGSHWDGFWDAGASTIYGSITPSADVAGLRWYAWIQPTVSTASFAGSASVGFAWATVEVGVPVRTPFYGGGMKGGTDPDLTPSWTGAVGASASILTGTRVTTAPGGITTFAIQSKQWADSGTASLRVISRWAYRGSGYVELAAADGTLQRGKTYTAMVTVRKTTATPDFDIGYLYYVGAGASWRRAFSPRTAGVHALRIVFTVADEGGGYLRLYHGGQIGDPDVWFDNFTLIEGDYTGPPFSGDSPGAIWDGTPHASTSRRWAPPAPAP